MRAGAAPPRWMGTRLRMLAVLTLGVEELTLALWVLTTTSAPSPSQLAVAAAGLVLGWLALRSLQRVPAEGRFEEFLGWVLRLHRCLLPYVFPPADRVTEDPRLPVLLRLAWLLLVKSGTANVSAVSLALCCGGHAPSASPWLLLAQQLVLALLLARQALAVGAAGTLCAELDGLLQHVLAPLRWELQAGWPAYQRGLPTGCLVVLVTTISAWVVSVPLYVGSVWGKKRRRPAGPGPRPAVANLHGTAGTREEAAADQPQGSIQSGVNATGLDLQPALRPSWELPGKAFVFVYLAVTVACTWECLRGRAGTTVG